jgi:hypothetical protein
MVEIGRNGRNWSNWSNSTSVEITVIYIYYLKIPVWSIWSNSTIGLVEFDHRFGRFDHSTWAAQLATFLSSCSPRERSDHATGTACWYLYIDSSRRNVAILCCIPKPARLMIRQLLPASTCCVGVTTQSEGDLKLLVPVAKDYGAWTSTRSFNTIAANCSGICSSERTRTALMITSRHLLAIALSQCKCAILRESFVRRPNRCYSNTSIIDTERDQPRHDDGVATKCLKSNTNDFVDFWLQSMTDALRYLLFTHLQLGMVRMAISSSASLLSDRESPSDSGGT